MLDCNDDVPAHYCSGSSRPLRDSAASAVLTAGQSVIIRVSKYGGTSLGSGSIVLNASFQQSNYCGTSAVAASVGANPFCNLGNHQPAILTTESSCGTNPNIYNAIWFNWVAPSDGSATFDTCGSGFDTKMAVYLACPTVFNNTALACNDDTPGCAAGNNPNYGSRITLDVVGGTQYLVRAGSFSPSGLGLGVLNITFSGSAGACCAGSTCSVVAPADCTGPGTRFIPNLTACNDAGNNSSPCCKADFNQTDGVTVQDIFDFLTAWFGADPTADFNGISGVGVQDIFDFLAAWFQGC